MKAYGIGPQSGIEGLHLFAAAEPVIEPGKIVVRVTAAGLNYRDLMLLRGQYGAAQPEKRIPLSDGVGIVEAIGDDVTGFQIGDRVIAPHFLGWADGPFSMAAFGQDMGVTADGWLAEKIAFPATAAIKLPGAISDATAATLAVAGATVWHAMVAFGQVKPGELVLAQGTGGVAIFALLLAKALGARFAITSSSDAKLERCKAMGADFVGNYQTQPDWPSALLAQTGGQGADVIIDTLGFPAFTQTIQAAAVNGRIGTLGALSGSPQDAATGSQGLIIAKNLTIKGIASGSRAMLQAVLEIVARHGIEMPIDRAFDFSDTPAAFTHLNSGTHLGKVLIRIN
ncbi:MAG: zinc-dependent alcohol dehydrogenase family protein [Sphingorhabdus sp.]